MSLVKRILPLFFIINVFVIPDAHASHSMGADLTYHCLGNNQYEVTLSFYRDCRGISAAPYADIFVSSSCYSDTLIRIFPIAGTGQEISQVCSTEVTTCNGGLYTGIQEYIYRGIINLPGACVDWSFSYDLCCRNAAITNVIQPDTNRIYIAATLNNTIVNCNSSPVFSNRPVPFICLGQQFCFNHGAFDSDGDSLVYQLINPLDTAGVPVVYATPFSPNNPLSSNPAFTFNPQTGDICMSPTQLQVTIMAVLVREYRNGVLIGTVERDIQVTVINCTNIIPSLSGINGGNDFDLTICVGEQACFNIVSADTNSQQNTFISWDYAIPGAVFTTIPGSREGAVFCWTPDSSDVSNIPHCFTATVVDDNCPYAGYQIYSYCITVQDLSVTAGPDKTVGCNSTTTLQATASGGTNYTYLWSTGQTTSSISAGPGTYIVTASNGSCTATDTVVVNTVINSPIAAFQFTKNCNSLQVAFNNLSTIGSGSISGYTWIFGDGTSSTQVNPTHTYLVAGSYNVSLIAQGASGCVDTMDAVITVSLNQPTALFSNTSSCIGSPVGFTDQSISPSSTISSWNWNFGNGATSTATNPATTYNIAGNYTITLTIVNADGCTASVTHPITVHPLPVADAGNPLQICKGSSAVLNATGGGTYNWSPVSSTASAITVTPATTTRYTVVVTDSYGCTASDTVTVAIRPDPVYGISNNRRICSGTSTTIGVSTNSQLTYLWSPTGATTQQIVVSPSASTYYRVIVTDQYGCTRSDSIRVTVLRSPDAIGSSTPVSCFGGNNGSASIAVTGGTAPFLYAWSSGLGTSNPVSGLSSGTYSAIVTDYNNCRDTVTIAVNQPSQILPNINATSPLCNGAMNGSANSSPAGGTPGYTYFWSPGGQTSSSINGLSIGNYALTVTDAQGCTSTDSILINEPSPLTILTTPNDALCAGTASGSAVATATGGTANYTYSWSPIAGNQATLQNIPSGNYQVTITDAHGCTNSASVSINEPLPLTLSLSAVDANCGTADGSAWANVSNGTAPYSYLWSNGQTNAMITGVVAGSYSVIVTDAHGCTKTDVVQINTTSLPIAAAVQLNPVSCHGGSDGALTIQSVTGNGPFSYMWSNGGTNNILSNLSAGTYSVVVTDNFGCQSTVSATVQEPSLLSVNINSVSVSCNGGSDGSLTAIGFGGVNPYQYSWNQGAYTGSSVNSLSVGNYSIVVTDANGCTVSSQSTITQPPAVVANVIANPALCSGASDGNATVLTQNGYGTMSYSWSPGGATTQTIAGLPAGLYTVQATDQHGCTAIASAQVSEPTPIVLNLNSLAPLCHGQSNGSATVVANGGSQGYHYFWAPLGQTTAAISNLPAGNYTVTVTDTNGCAAQSTIQISQPSQLTALATSTPNTCGLSDGTATVQSNGGTGSYTYLWTPGNISASLASGLNNGSYSVTVTDANGCTTVTSTTVNTIGYPSLVTAAVNHVSCNGGSDGSAIASSFSGNGPFTYYWSTGSTSNTVNSLSAGIYNLTIMDINGCTASDTVLIKEPPVLNVVASAAPVNCNGASSGSVSASATGGTAPYSYSWNQGLFSGRTVSGLSAGNYTVIVTDSKGCTDTTIATVNQPLPMLATAASTPVLCSGGSSGTATVNVQNGSGVLSYVWQPGGAGARSINGLMAGNYHVVVTDANGCTATDSVLVTQPAPVAISFVISPVVCYGQQNGAIQVNPTGGVGSYIYQWSNGAQGALNSGLGAGNYNVVVSDANGCTVTGFTMVTQPASLVIASSSSPATCGLSDGTAGAIVNGGTRPYSYSWSVNQATTSTVSGLPAGSYNVTVTDSRGCSQNNNVTVATIGAPLLSATVINNVSCYGQSDGSAGLQTVNGNAPFTYSWSNGASGSTASNLTSGVYILTATDVNGCYVQDTVEVMQPLPLILISSASPANCFGASTGSVAVVAQGGNGSYSCVWSPGGFSGLSISGLTAGVYSAFVTDNKGCTASASAIVNEPPRNQLVTSVSPISCFGGSNGAASVQVLNNNAIAQYVWYPGAIRNDTASNLSAGNYYVVVTDSAGCIDTAHVTVNTPSAVNVLINSTAVICHGDSNGAASVQVSGGVAGYQYLWSPGGYTTASIAGLAPQQYQVVVTDANSCTSSATINVTEPAPVIVSTSSTPATCGVSDGSVAAIATGGVSPYQYSWNAGQFTGSSVSSVSSGSYQVQASDANGCTVSGAVYVQATGAPSVDAAVISDVSCFGASDGSATVQSVSGNAPFTYLWSTGSVSSTASGLSAGIHIVEVTDVHGCTAMDTITIIQPDELIAYATVQPANCNGSADGAVSISVSGGTPVYVYMWSVPGISGSAANLLPAGNYSALITDDHGCNAVINAVVTQPSALSLNTGSTPVSCNGYSDGVAFASATGGTGNIGFVWPQNSLPGDSLFGLLAGSYSVIATDLHGCSTSGSVVINEPAPIQIIATNDTLACYGNSNGALQASATGGNGGYTFSWVPGNFNGAVINNLSQGQYQVTVQDVNGCSSTRIAEVISPLPLNINVTGPGNLCSGQSALLTANAYGGTLPYTFVWNDGALADTHTVAPVVTTTYFVNVTDANGCTVAPSQLVISVGPPLQVNISQPPSICEGDSVLVSASASGGNSGPYQYTWNGGAFNGNQFYIKPVSDTILQVMVNDGCSGPVMGTVLLQINPLPQVQFTPQSIEGCAPVVVNFSNLIGVPAGSSYSWDFGDFANSNAQFPTHSFVEPGYYTVSLSITTPEGCTANERVLNAVHVYGYPVALFQQSTDLLSTFAPTITLSDRSIDALTWQWDFGDGSMVGGDPNPSHVYGDSGTYQIQLIVTGAGGCPDTVYGTVRVEPEFSIYIPNAFTPNGDGINDGFIAYGMNIVDYEMWILDRWGMEIYHASDFHHPWDGTYYGNDKPCQNDVYEYVIDVTDLNLRKRRYIGHVTLVR